MPNLSPPPSLNSDFNIVALIIRIGFWGPLYYNYNKEPTQNSIGKLLQVIKALIQNSLAYPYRIPERSPLNESPGNDLGPYFTLLQPGSRCLVGFSRLLPSLFLGFRALGFRVSGSLGPIDLSWK